MENLLVPPNNESAFTFIKFGNKEKIKKLQRGQLYMKNFKYFRELEKKSGVRGVGDEQEAYYVLNTLNLQIFDKGTGLKVLESNACNTALSLKDVDQFPVFCLYCLDFRSIKITENRTDFKADVVFTDEQKRNIKETFGDTALLISPIHFIQAISNKFRKSNISFVGKKVKYSDFSINCSDRIEDCNEDFLNSCFWKDEFFEYQREYRVVIKNKKIPDHYEINIGSMKSYSTMMKVDDLLNGEYGLFIKGEDLYKD